MSDEGRDLLLFQVGERLFAAAVGDALRIGSVREVPAGELVVETALGLPLDRARGIAVAAEDGVVLVLVVDRVLGVRTVPATDLLPLPGFAAACLASGAVTGFALVDEAPVLLVDLPTLVRERPGAPRDQRAA